MTNETDMWGADTIEPPKPESQVAKLHKARFVKNDEFYTQYSDIVKELQHYAHHFKGKVVYCNCDDPAKSNFIKYFRQNYDDLGLAGLLKNHLRHDGSGDFRGREALAKLEQADIVVTNPPFSLFRQYLAQLMDAKPDGVALLKAVEPSRDKKFLVMGSMNSFSYSSIFPLLQNNILWSGVNSGAMNFTKPDGTMQSLGNVTWFTNLDHPARHKELKLTRKYDPTTYPKYDNYNAINIDRIKHIPRDYAGAMGVPITFMLRYNPEQFKILDLLMTGEIKGERKYGRFIIGNRNPTEAAL